VSAPLANISSLFHSVRALWSEVLGSKNRPTAGLIVSGFTLTVSDAESVFGFVGSGTSLAGTVVPCACAAAA
jgi:hypothetical protein